MGTIIGRPPTPFNSSTAIEACAAQRQLARRSAECPCGQLVYLVRLRKPWDLALTGGAVAAPRSRYFCQGERGAVRTDVRPNAPAVRPNVASKVASPSWRRDRAVPSSGMDSRSCWRVHADEGCRVTLMCTMRRRSWARTTKTNRIRQVSVGTIRAGTGTDCACRSGRAAPSARRLVPAALREEIRKGRSAAPLARSRFVGPFRQCCPDFGFSWRKQGLFSAESGQGGGSKTVASGTVKSRSAKC